LVDDVLGYVQGLWHQFELSVDVNYPLDQESSGGVLNLSLHLIQVVWIHQATVFLLPHVLVDLLREFRDALWISKIELVRQCHIFHLIFPPFNDSLFENFRHCFCLEVFNLGVRGDCGPVQLVYCILGVFLVGSLQLAGTLLVLQRQIKLIVTFFLVCLNLTLRFLGTDRVGIHTVLRVEVAHHMGSILFIWDLNALVVVRGLQEVVTFL